MASKFEWNRRSFIKSAAVLGAAPLLAGGSMAQQQSAQSNQIPDGQVPKKPLGRTGVQVSAMGLGGYHLGSAETDQAAIEIVAKAFDHGVRFFDNAWEYHDGLSEERLGKALRSKRDQSFVMTKVCTHGRDKKIAMRMLEESLRRLQTDHLDLWQIHEVVYDNDPDLIFVPDGAAEALQAAKQQGKVRYIGVSNFLAYRLARALGRADLRSRTRFVSVQPRYSLLFREIERELLPLAQEEGLGVIPYNPLAGGLLTGKHQRGAAPTPGTRFTLGTAGPRYQERYWHDPEFAKVEALRKIVTEAGYSLSALAKPQALSLSACSRIRAGAQVPHPRHRDGLLALVDAGN